MPLPGIYAGCLDFDLQNLCREIGRRKRSEAKDVAGGEIGAALEGIILCGENTGGWLIGVCVALEVVNESGTRIEAENGIAGSVEFDGAAEVESIAPGAFVGSGTSWNKGLVVVNEAVTEIEKEAPSI